ncbi:hypothetical protein LguiB_005330 [Lonicera macranthoides]
MQFVWLCVQMIGFFFLKSLVSYIVEASLGGIIGVSNINLHFVKPCKPKVSD